MWFNDLNETPITDPYLQHFTYETDSAISQIRQHLDSCCCQNTVSQIQDLSSQIQALHLANAQTMLFQEIAMPSCCQTTVSQIQASYDEIMPCIIECPNYAIPGNCYAKQQVDNEHEDQKENRYGANVIIRGIVLASATILQMIFRSNPIFIIAKFISMWLFIESIFFEEDN